MNSDVVVVKGITRSISSFMSDERAMASLGRLAAMARPAASAEFDESRLVMPGDWATLDDEHLDSSVEELSMGVDAVMEAVTREIAAEKMGTLGVLASAAPQPPPPPPATPMPTSGDADTQALDTDTACLVLRSDGKARVVHARGYNGKKRTWQVVERDGGTEHLKVKPSALSLLAPSPMRLAVTVEGLKARNDLNGRTALLLAYQALEERFAIECAGETKALLVRPDNLRDAASGAILTPPVEVADSLSGQKLLRATRRLAGGEVIFEEAPVVHREGSAESIERLADDIHRVLAMDQKARDAPCTLHPAPCTLHPVLAMDQKARGRVLALHHNGG